MLLPCFISNGKPQTCDNFTGIGLSHTMKLWERVVKTRRRAEVETCEQYGFMVAGRV